jgi:hypothetical protein
MSASTVVVAMNARLLGPWRPEGEGAPPGANAAGKEGAPWFKT